MCKSESKTPPKPSATPNSAQPANNAVVPCHKGCTLTSLTVATSPADRARTKIGAGEEVTLTVTGNPATWAITAGSGELTPNSGVQPSVTFKADDAAGSVTITATASGCSCTHTMTFNVVQPSHWTMKRKTGTNLRHKKGRPDCGWKGIVYLHPDGVNFYNLEVRELDSQYVGTGSYSGYNGDYHGNYPLPDRAGPWIPIVSHNDADGSGYGGADTVYTGDPGPAVTGAAPPFKKGSGYFPITRQWQVAGKANIHDFAVIRQEDEIFASGRCESRKAGNVEFTLHSDATSTY